jgi:eukaryotic-like serine/threonine-protein kinase
MGRDQLTRTPGGIGGRMARIKPSEGTRPTVDAFLRTILRSRLLDREGLQAGLRGVPREQRNDPDALAAHLVRVGKLSRFQAGKLLRGVASGLVLGPYQILAPLGKGGMGWVFLANDTRSKMLVALKILPPERARTEERTLARFRREMELSQKVAHEHIAWTYEVGQCRNVNYIAMEYIPGKTLSRLVNEGGPLPLARAARLMVEVALGLEHAHGRGMIHRDLKPSNIQVTPADHAKILDLGLALIDGETGLDHTIVGGQGYIVGTMDYISPEQTNDAVDVGPRSDLYSLGCTLYFTLTGSPPFAGGTSREKVHRHRSSTPPPIENVRPDLPPEFVRLLRQLMHKNPERRPESAHEVAERLHIWATDAPPQSAVDTVNDDPTTILETASSSEFTTVQLPMLEEVPDEEEEEENEEPLPTEGRTPVGLLVILLTSLAVLVGALVVGLAFLLRS